MPNVDEHKRETWDMQAQVVGVNWLLDVTCENRHIPLSWLNSLDVPLQNILYAQKSYN